MNKVLLYLCPIGYFIHLSGSSVCWVLVLCVVFLDVFVMGVLCSPLSDVVSVAAPQMVMSYTSAYLPVCLNVCMYVLMYYVYIMFKQCYFHGIHDTKQ